MSWHLICTWSIVNLTAVLFSIEPPFGYWLDLIFFCPEKLLECLGGTVHYSISQSKPQVIHSDSSSKAYCNPSRITDTTGTPSISTRGHPQCSSSHSESSLPPDGADQAANAENLRHCAKLSPFGHHRYTSHFRNTWNSCLHSMHFFSKILIVGTRRILPNHATKLVKDSFDFTFSLPHSGHFAFIRGFWIIMADLPFARWIRFRCGSEFRSVGWKNMVDQIVVLHIHIFREEALLQRLEDAWSRESGRRGSALNLGWLWQEFKE